MDVSASLKSSEIDALRDPDRPLSSSLPTNPNLTTHEDESPFEKALQLKNTLDEYESLAHNDPSWEKLAILSNCEVKLFKLNEGIELRLNPFLSHWVEVVLRLSSPLGSEGNHAQRKVTARNSIPREDVNNTRVELVKEMLNTRSVKSVEGMSPRGLVSRFKERRKTQDFNVSVYIRMLEEEGIYETSSTTSATAAIPPSTTNATTEEGEKERKEETAKDWKQILMERLGSVDPEPALQDLTRLPLSLPSLDFLTTLLQDKTLSNLHIAVDAPSLIRDYVQHCLRLIEGMGLPTSPTTTSITPGTLHSGFFPSNGGGSGSSDIGQPAGATVDHDRGREAQSRAVKLLLLFLRNLIRKGLVPPSELYFEIQEVCVRYVWIREVREFRGFVESGVDGEADGSGGVGPGG